MQPILSGCIQSISLHFYIKNVFRKFKALFLNLPCVKFKSTQMINEPYVDAYKTPFYRFWRDKPIELVVLAVKTVVSMDKPRGNYQNDLSKFGTFLYLIFIYGCRTIRYLVCQLLNAHSCFNIKKWFKKNILLIPIITSALRFVAIDYHEDQAQMVPLIEMEKVWSPRQTWYIIQLHGKSHDC